MAVSGPLSLSTLLPLVVFPLAKPYQEPQSTEPVNVHLADLPGPRGTEEDGEGRGSRDSIWHSSDVTLGKFLNLSMPQLAHLQLIMCCKDDMCYRRKSAENWAGPKISTP